jgi:hypothetical protein
MSDLCDWLRHGEIHAPNISLCHRRLAFADLPVHWSREPDVHFPGEAVLLSHHKLLALAVAAGCGFVCEPVQAGMPSPHLVFTELGQRRTEELSFFLMSFLLLAAIVRWLWNFVQRDFPQLPRLTYWRSVTVLILWGLFMTVVLSLISGARELMTPAAWEPTGVTYKLRSGSTTPADASPFGQPNTVEAQRVQRLEALRFALWQFAAQHEGRFPTDDESSSIAADVWHVEPAGRLKYRYLPGLTTKQPDAVLVYEPQIHDDGQLMLLTSGRIAKLHEVSTIARSEGE